MTYKVIAYFCDLMDKNRPYNVGDTFPHEDCSYKPDEKRLAELAGSENKQGKPLVEAVEEKPAKKTAKKAE